MYLKTINLRHFRNYQEQIVAFTAPKTILVGDNAQGKSNLLEAVELLSTLKSSRAQRDRDLIIHTENIGQIHGILERQIGMIELSITLRSQGGRTVGINGETIRRHLDFISILNAVQFSSLDLELVRGSPEHRRHWLDHLVVQLEPFYAHILHEYNQVLRQRNALLKRLKQENHSREMSTELALWDAQLATIGSRVIRRRSRAILRLAPLATVWHQAISGSKENLGINYQPNVGNDQELNDIDDNFALQQAFLTKIQLKAIPEQYQGTSLVGPHRDDINFTINETPAKQYASQGQQRTLVLSLKLAELQLIEQVVGEPPLLLLDDVLAELDMKRQNQLLEAISNRFQTIITTTHLGSFDAQWLKDSQILAVDSGRIFSQLESPLEIKEK